MCCWKICKARRPYPTRVTFCTRLLLSDITTMGHIVPQTQSAAWQHPYQLVTFQRTRLLSVRNPTVRYLPADKRSSSFPLVSMVLSNGHLILFLTRQLLQQLRIELIQTLIQYNRIGSQRRSHWTARIGPLRWFPSLRLFRHVHGLAQPVVVLCGAAAQLMLR